MAEESKTAFEGGATRTAQKTRFDLIPPVALEMLAERLCLGAEKHGARNWEKGGADFEAASISHLMGHLTSYMKSPNRVDASALICNAAFLCFFQDQRDTTKES